MTSDFGSIQSFSWHHENFAQWTPISIRKKNLNKANKLLFTEVEVNNCGTEVSNCVSIYRTSWLTSGPKSNFICDNIPTKAILFSSAARSEVNSIWLITSKLANQRARKVNNHLCDIY